MGMLIFFGIVAIFVSTCVIYSLIQKGIDDKRNNRCGRLEKDIDSLNHLIGDLTKAKNEAEEKKNRLEIDVHKTNNEIARLRPLVKELQEYQNRARPLVEKLMLEKEDADKIIDELTQENRILRLCQEQLRNELNSACEELAENKTTVVKLNNSLIDYTESSEKYQTKFNDLEQSNTELEEKNQELLCDNASKDEQMERLIEECERLSIIEEKLNAKIQELQAKNQELVARLKKECVIEECTFVKENEKLKKKNKELETEKGQLKEKELNKVKQKAWDKFFKSTEKILVEKYNLNALFDSFGTGRFDRAMSDKIQMFDLSISAKFVPSKKNEQSEYTTDLFKCSCDDFKLQNKPCKHMIHLAYSVGAIQLNAMQFEKTNRRLLEELGENDKKGGEKKKQSRKKSKSK